MRVRRIVLGAILIACSHACGGPARDQGTTDGQGAFGGSLASGGGEGELRAGSAGSTDSTSGGTTGAGTAGTGGGPTGGTGGDGIGGNSAGGSSGVAGDGAAEPSACDPWLVDYASCGAMVPNEICMDCDSTGVVTRFCQTGTFVPRQTPCAPHRCTDEAVPGADADCEPEQICVVHRTAGGEALSMECVDNPCGSAIIDRDCAETTICPDDRLRYVGSDGGGVSVDCYGWPPDCPDSPPQVGDPCPLNEENCVYQDCEGYGLIQAQCNEGLWSIYNDVCRGGACGSETCEVGEICSSLTLPGLMIPSSGCSPPPDEPGLVAQGTLVCTYGNGGASISGGLVSTSCYCSPSGC